MRLCGVALMLAMWGGTTGMAGLQGQVADDFSAGSFSAKGWKGDTAHFRFTSSSAIPQAQCPALQLNTTGSGTSLIYNTFPLKTKSEWSVWCKLSFNPSSSNYTRFYLTGGNAFPASTNGSLFVGIGMNSDRVGIYRQDNDQITALFTDTTTLLNQSTNQIRVLVRYAAPWWYYAIDPTGGYNLACTDSFTFTPSSDTGLAALWCQYTSSNATKFYFDDVFAGSVPEDTIPPQLVSAMVPEQQLIRLAFTEPINGSMLAAGSGCFSVAGIQPLIAYYDPLNLHVINLLFQDPFPDGDPFDLSIKNLTDKAGNPMPDTLLSLTWHQALRNEVVISEIMADPSPPVKLPESEYIELQNTADFPISLCNWILWIDETPVSLPCRVMEPGASQLLVNEKDTLLWSYLPEVAGLTSFQLRNSDATLALQDQHGRIIHAVSYSSQWHQTDFQEAGGYSLELKDLSNPCEDLNTWGSTLDLNGGTPGAPNSYSTPFADRNSPALLQVYVSDPWTIRLSFSESVDTIRKPHDLFRIAGSSTMITGSGYIPPMYRQAYLFLGEPLKTDTVYLLELFDTLCDCMNNRMATGTVPFGIPSVPDSSDLVINELMYKPLASGAEYLELFNRSKKIIDLSTCLLAKIDTLGNTLIDLYPLTDEQAMLFPGELVVITADVFKLLASHPAAKKEKVLRNLSMPALTDDGDVLAIIGPAGLRIDQAAFHNQLHAPWIADPRGISLERLSGDLPGLMPENWYSASEASGWGTPTLPNSQCFGAASATGRLEVTPRSFRPGHGTGTDLVQITLSGIKPGSTLSISVFSETGMLAKQIVSEGIPAETDVWRWDGTGHQGQLNPRGIYLIEAVVYHRDTGSARYFCLVVLL
ncbi:MAG TPA: lamin tail domain-containing protein [Bacteroidales bacterium]|nr:lamin tail domain-containing protein [Bacteroidales bacterium]